MDTYEHNVPNFDGENILSSLNLLLFVIPQDVPTIDKVRWLYIKMGELFSYDYRIANNESVATKQIDFMTDYVSRYQTCIQISYLLNLILNNIDGVKSKIIQRKTTNRGTHNIEHEAVEVQIDEKEKYILDLTLDLYLIQSGCQTREFGYTTDPMGECDILPLMDVEEIDKRLGLIKNGEYTDKKIRDTKSRVNMMDFSQMTRDEEIDYRLTQIKQLIPNFPGYHEAKQFINKLFYEILCAPYKEYNLTYKENENVELVTCFEIISDNNSIWYLYNSKVGLTKTSPQNIKNMMACGWTTRSKTLTEELEKSCEIKR